MLICNLTKPEATFDVVRKQFPKLKPTDAALVATALVESGRFAKAVHDGNEYEWRAEEHDAMTGSLLIEVQQVQEAVDPEKPAKKSAKPEEPEAVTLTVTLRPSQRAGEAILGDREDLKTLLSDIIEGGVEFHFSPTDIGWHWTLERVNWSTISAGELKRRVKFRPTFEGDSVAVELGPSGKVKKQKK